MNRDNSINSADSQLRMLLTLHWHAGAFANLMRLLKQDNGEQIGFTVWQAQLQAILRTSRSLTLSKLAAVPDLVPTLTAMLKAAEQDQQVLLLSVYTVCSSSYQSCLQSRAANLAGHFACISMHIESQSATN